MMADIMFLPEHVRSCIDTLETRGFVCYAVGGCVRDALLDLTPSDYDLCTDASPEEIRIAFSHCRLVLAGEKHGTVGVVTQEGVVEITTFRTEGDYSDSRHPGWVSFVKTIEEDLSRRDFTVNAMAYSPIRGFADPWGGREDLKKHILRAVGDPAVRFQEDALRILRGVRFAVRYQLQPEQATKAAMFSQAGLLDKIARERIFDELCKTLPLVSAENLLEFAPVFCQVIPELSPTVDFDQRNSHHAYDLYTHIAHVTAATDTRLPLRWAALLHDIGKVETFTLDDMGQGHFYGHGAVSAQIADEILRRIKAPTSLREDVMFLISNHMNLPEPERKSLRRRLSRWGEDRLRLLLALQRADSCCKGVENDPAYFDEIDALLTEILAENACLTLRDLAVNGHDLMALGFDGCAIGDCLNQLLTQVVEETIPNEKTALLQAASQIKG